METKKIVESLLFINPGLENQLRSSYIINDEDRNWKPENHSELFFIDNFKDPYFLIIVDKRIHVYIIGEKDKGKAYHILCVEGNTTNYLTMAKGHLLNYIRDNIKSNLQEFLPSSITQRIMFIDRGYKELYIFNRVALDDKMLNTSKWTLNQDVYRADSIEYETKCFDILNVCLKELQESEESND